MTKSSRIPILERTYLNRAAALSDIPKAPGRRDVYKNRSEAFDDFILAELPQPVSRATFYDHCKTIPGLLQPDKTIWLADIENYVKEHLKIDPSTKRLLEDRQKNEADEKERSDLSLRRDRADTIKAEEAAKEAQRKNSNDWIEKETHEMQLGAFASRINEALRQIVSLRLDALVHVCGVDSARAAEFSAAIEELHAEALSSVSVLAVDLMHMEVPNE